MSSAKLAGLLVLAALAIAGCGGAVVAVQPTVGHGSTSPSRGRIDNASTNNPNHLACLRQAHLPITEVTPHRLQVGSLPAGPTVLFTPTPGTAQGDQIAGTAQGAEVIGSALLYVNQGSDEELRAIEDCLQQGVTG